MSQPAPRSIVAFRKAVYRHFAENGRDLPWRKMVTPYTAFVAEIMLQQTQVPRVAMFFPKFIRLFPNWKRLAHAPLKDVLAAWQGMGYNRRAKFLHRAAQEVVGRFGGTLPDGPELLQTLPGVGTATAASIAAFGFDKPTVFVETNIRAVFIHHFFKGRSKIPDGEILSLVAATLDRKNPRKWYSALMDYGTHLKKIHQNPARRSKHHKKQGKFEGSARQVRGRVLALVVAAGTPLKKSEIIRASGFPPERVSSALAALVQEGLVRKTRTGYTA